MKLHYVMYAENGALSVRVTQAVPGDDARGERLAAEVFLTKIAPAFLDAKGKAARAVIDQIEAGAYKAAFEAWAENRHARVGFDHGIVNTEDVMDVDALAELVEKVRGGG